MERYDEYKDSGIVWIGEIPAGWEVVPLKSRYHFVTGFTPDTKRPEYYDADGYDWVTISDLTDDVVTKTDSHISSRYIDEYNPNPIPKGSLMYSFKLSAGKTAFAGEDCFTNEAIASFDPSNPCLGFLRYSSYLIEFAANENIYGAKILNSSLLRNAAMIFPPLDEQRAIAAYLDCETAKVDSLIADCEREVELLQEYRKAVISEAVTKGLDPNAPMKDSGIEWIGEIPEGWKVVPFKIAARVVADLQDPQNYPDLFQVSPERIEKDTGKLLECKSVSEAGVESDNHLFHEGDILYSKVRPALNKVTIATFDGMCSADMYPIQTSFNHCWLKYYMLSDTFMKQVIVSTDRVKMPKLNKEELGRFKVVLPGNNEQRAIATYLDEKTAEIDALVADYQSMAKKLREYRKSLISEAVTGKFKVPGLA